MRADTWALLAALAAALAEPPPALRCRHENCTYVGRDFLGHSQYNVDEKQIWIHHKVGSLMIDCERADLLESRALPRAEPALRVSRVELFRCPLPRAGSLAGTLAALRVTLERGNLTFWFPPPDPPFAARHFAGLDRLLRLEIYGTENSRSSPGFLAPLLGLRSLEMWDVALPAGELDVPPSLRKLDLNVVNMKRLVEAPDLEWLRVVGWTEPRPAPLARCDSLRELHLVRPAVEALLDGWLANCSCLELIDIDDAKLLTSLPPKLLVGARALQSLTFTGGTLVKFPADLLDYSPDLRILRLNDNRLRTLPRCTFAVARRVLELDLSSNQLESSALDALAPLEELTILNLTSNPSLGDVCTTDGYSPIRDSTKLRQLLLIDTKVTRICRDWRENMTLLETLDLRRTRVSVQTFEELRFVRTLDAVVVLPATSVTAVEMTREDYIDAARGQSSDASVHLDAAEPLACDCRMYWTRRALDLPLPALRQVGGLRCPDDRLLRHVPPEDMVCARQQECTEAALPAACACATRPDDDSEHDRRLVRVRCENASLTRVPRLRALNHSTERLYELLLANNNITDLHANDLQDNIKGLDLRNNSLTRVDEETARRLGSVSGMLRLAGNSLECSCHAAPLLHALHARNTTQLDLSNVTCSDGSPLYAAFTMNCSQGASSIAPPAASPGTWVAGGLAALLALVAAVTGCLASRQRRFFALAVLHRWGCACPAEDDSEAEDERPYDLFVTFSHVDSGVVHELMARLEPAYRLCVHYRDWTPGRLICEQVVESVRESRRTVALVSRHFLASSWPRAEFREAHTQAMLDARPRLIVVLLEEPAALQLDEQLQLYVSTQTYLRWGEPYFWDKLAVALPRPRVPRAPPAPPPGPALALLPAPRAPPAPPPGPALALLPAPRAPPAPPPGPTLALLPAPRAPPARRITETDTSASVADNVRLQYLSPR